MRFLLIIWHMRYGPNTIGSGVGDECDVGMDVGVGIDDSEEVSEFTSVTNKVSALLLVLEMTSAKNTLSELLGIN